ncbi:YnbE family lipoprotein [Lacimicrobium alkaliphilum]|jgi:outer membrane biogenesis lipoprotein LolB|uniref:YnbE family lipoprotein n=1 Tax=Lacimicrobium alkaliphilum TaxID=1526571 RepID=A0ABQ1RLC9_9ALTE|nr:YnbE family lipoprotein [Lacimicrobium alkaliphilum]GGD74412.1 YnbE family lipoprotein [Lacimicrobium alkaliphilum]
MRIKAVKIVSLLVAGLMLSACTHKVQVETKEPITINLNVKVDHQIRVKVDKELDDLFSEDSELF